MNKNKVSITIINEVQLILHGVQPDHIQKLRRKYSKFVKGYFFSPKYNLGRWDGKKYFVSDNGLTYIHLIEGIVNELKAYGYNNFNVDDKRKHFDIEFDAVDETLFSSAEITLADHQVNAINSLLENRGGVLEAGTGAGKTFITAALCKRFNEKQMNTIVIVPNYDLVVQTIASFKRLGISVGEYSGPKKDLNHMNVISTWQALQNNTDVLKMFNCLILDECHLIAGNVIQTIITDHSNHMPVRIGLTGTIPEDECNQMILEANLGKIVYKIPAKDLIDKGWLSKMNIDCYTIEHDITPLYKNFLKNNKNSKISYKEYFDGFFPDFASEMSYVTNNVNRDRIIAGMVEKISQLNGNSLIILNSVKHGKKLEKLIPNSVFVYGKVKSKDRQKNYAAYKDRNDVIMISTYKLVQAGLDIPRIFNIFLIDGGKSFTKVIQTLGRGLRKAHDKEVVNVFDIHSNFKYGKKHLSDRIRFYKKERHTYTVHKIKLQPVEAVAIETDGSIDFE